MAHYQQGPIECIDAMHAAFGPAQMSIFCRINAMKYLWRADHHAGGVAENLEKAVYYVKKALYYELQSAQETIPEAAGD